jgi:hypothetical protein
LGCGAYEIIEKMQRRFIKSSLGPPSYTTTHIIIMGSERVEIPIYCLRGIVRYLGKVLEMGESRWARKILSGMVKGWGKGEYSDGDLSGRKKIERW